MISHTLMLGVGFLVGTFCVEQPEKAAEIIAKVKAFFADIYQGFKGG